jgi:diacylglycerol kinase family enzyme
VERPLDPSGEKGTQLVVVVNGRASGIEDPPAPLGQLTAALEELGATADAVVTRSERDLWEELRVAVSHGQRVVLVGGTGRSTPPRAPVPRLPELALVPAGRANNIARGLPVMTTGMNSSSRMA